MRRYETIYILRPTLGENEINTVIENTNAIIGSGGGEIIALDKWGLRKLAYLIKKESNGYYVFCDYGTSPDNVAEMERKFRIDDAVLKYMTVKIADFVDADGIVAAREAYEAAKIAAAEKLARQEEEAAEKSDEDAEESAEELESEESGE